MSVAATAAMLPCAARAPRAWCVRASKGRVSGRRAAALVPRASAGGEADAQQARLRAAAKLTVDKFLRPGQTVGLGTGAAVNAVIEEIAQRITAGELQGLRCVAASPASASEAAFHGVPLAELAAAAAEGEQLRPDVLLEVADELDATDPGLSFVTGRGARPQQPQLVRARQLAAAAEVCVVLVDGEDKLVTRLGGDVPVVVEAEGWEDTGEELDDIFIGDADIWRRSLEQNAGPRGGDHPYVSEQGHNILDVRFYDGLKLFGEEAGYAAIAREIESVPGVVAHGLYANVAAAAVVATAEGPRELARGVPLSAGAAEE